MSTLRSSSLTILLGELPGLARLPLLRLLASCPEVRVLGPVATAEEMGQQLRRARPQLIIAGEAALPALARYNQHLPVPVLLVSEGQPLPAMLREAARWGVFAQVPPLSRDNTPDAVRQRGEYWRHIRSVQPAEPVAAPVRSSLLAPPQGVVILGGSTGGTPAVEAVISGLLPSLRQAVVVAVHLPQGFSTVLVERLRRVSRLPVQLAGPGSQLEAGKVLVVPGGCNMRLQANHQGPWLHWRLELAPEAPASPDIPSVDLLLSSAAPLVGRRLVGVVLSGLGSDGTHGARVARQHGATILAQDAHSSSVFSMPKSVIQAGLASRVLPLADIAEFINSRSGQPASAARPAQMAPLR